MQNTLEAFGVGPKMMRWINALYNHPTAKVKINGTVSEPFEMYNGTRQGCPLSPLLFVLPLEPLQARVRQSPDIRGIQIENEVHEVAAYADDILFYIINPGITLPNLLKILKAYGDVANFKINPSKSEILNISVRPQEEQIYKQDFPFIWRDTKLKYLGVKITPSHETIFQQNFFPLLNDIKSDLNKIASRQRS